MEPEVPEVPEVIVRSARRHRSRTAPLPQPPAQPNVRNWLIYAALAVGTAALMIDGFLTDTPSHLPLPSLSEAIEVRSAIAQSADSLQVVVSWELTLSGPQGAPDSVRVRVISKHLRDTLVQLQPANQLADTAYLPAPSPGETATGVSCVAADHLDEPLKENCTPWQYVRPVATAGPPPTTRTNPASASAMVPTRIVLEPSGLQVDPDVGGKCAEWQRTHPTESVWVQVNQIAVYQCMGPNKKPTVAQFCAFAVLPDGRRVKMANSVNNNYCDELFEEWIRERYS